MSDNQERLREIETLKQRLAALEAAPQASASGPSAPVEGSSDKSARIGIGLIVVIGLGLVAYCSQSQPSAPTGGSGQTAIQQEISASVADQPMATLPAPNLTSWSYRDTVDPMTDKKTEFACVTSTNEVLLNPPYDNVRAELCIRQSPRYGLDAFIQLLGDGQIICRSYDNCTVQVRFGQGSQQSFSATDAADGSSNITFITNASRFVTGAKGSDVTRVQMTFYEAGNQVIEFNTKGLEWPRPAG